MPALLAIAEPLALIMKNPFILLFFLTLSGTWGLIAQDTLGVEKVNTVGDMAFVKSTGELFTGILQSRKKNGQIAFEFEFDKGLVRTQYIYFRNKKNNEKLAGKVLYHTGKPWREATEIRYLPKFDKWTHYDGEGKQTLVEHRKDGITIYRCEYNGRKKHGKEMWLNDDGTKLFYEYVNGKEKKQLMPTKPINNTG
ncbi:MAG: hypothetical protein ABJN95_11130 [Maribacter sp.]|uniref:hypothetical protein n=1 Tax=Maribacter sp. TaxID=1897614 RepID=UPI0032977BA3